LRIAWLRTSEEPDAWEAGQPAVENRAGGVDVWFANAVALAVAPNTRTIAAMHKLLNFIIDYLLVTSVTVL
jgi:hypothetical protein